MNWTYRLQPFGTGSMRPACCRERMVMMMDNEQRDLVQHEEPRDPLQEVEDKLDQLSMGQERYLLRVLAGQSISTIEKNLRIEPGTIQEWRKNERFTEIESLNRTHAAKLGKRRAAAILNTSAAEAAYTLVDVMGPENHARDRRGAAADILDRVGVGTGGGLPTVVKETHTMTTIVERYFMAMQVPSTSGEQGRVEPDDESS